MCPVDSSNIVRTLLSLTRLNFPLKRVVNIKLNWDNQNMYALYLIGDCNRHTDQLISNVIFNDITIPVTI